MTLPEIVPSDDPPPPPSLQALQAMHPGLPAIIRIRKGPRNPIVCIWLPDAELAGALDNDAAAIDAAAAEAAADGPFVPLQEVLNGNNKAHDAVFTAAYRVIRPQDPRAGAGGRGGGRGGGGGCGGGLTRSGHAFSQQLMPSGRVSSVSLEDHAWFSEREGVCWISVLISRFGKRFCVVRLSLELFITTYACRPEGK